MRRPVAQTVGAIVSAGRKPSETWGDHAGRRNGRRARRSAAAWSRSKLPFMTEVWTLSIRCATRGDQRICCCAAIRRCSSYCTQPSVGAVEIGSSHRQTVA